MKENEERLKEVQEKCEIAKQNIEQLKKEPKLLGRVYSLIAALIIIIFIVICIFCIKKEIWTIAVISGFIAWVGCFVPYYIYRNVKTRKEIENIAKINELQDMIYDIQKEIRKNSLDKN